MNNNPPPINLWHHSDTIEIAVLVVLLGWLVGWLALRTFYRGKVTDARCDAQFWCAEYHKLADTVGETIEDRRSHYRPEHEPRTLRQARRHTRGIRSAADAGVFDDQTSVMDQVELEPWMLPDANAPAAEQVSWPPTLHTAVWAAEVDGPPGEDTAPHRIITEVAS